MFGSHSALGAVVALNAVDDIASNLDIVVLEREKVSNEPIKCRRFEA